MRNGLRRAVAVAMLNLVLVPFIVLMAAAAQATEGVRSPVFSAVGVLFTIWLAMVCTILLFERDHDQTPSARLVRGGRRRAPSTARGPSTTRAAAAAPRSNAGA